MLRSIAFRDRERHGHWIASQCTVAGYCPVQTETMQAISWQQHDVFAFQGRPYLQQSDRDGIFYIEIASSRITREFWYRMFYLQDKSLTDIVRHVKSFRSWDSVAGTVTVPGVRYPGSATYFCLFLNFQTASGATGSGYRVLLITVSHVLRENVLGKCN